MPKSEKRVTKGFGFYLLMLILVLFAAFMIIVCIMMFSPKKVILGYQYFVYGEEKILETTTDDSATPFDFANTNKIVINGANSKVSIIKSDKATKENVIIVNKSNGFAKWSDNVNFSYSVVYEVQGEGESATKTLKIDVSQPQGFLHFTSDFQVVIRVPGKGGYNFENTAFDVTTTSGSVIVGNTTALQDKNADANMNINNLSVSTDSGRVLLTKYNEQKFNNISVSTKSGSFISEVEDLNVESSAKFITTNGSITLKNFAFKNAKDEDDVSKTLDLNLENGSFTAGKVAARIDFVAASAKINVDNVVGSFVGNDAADKIDRTNIVIGEVGGNVSLPNVKASDVNIGNVGGEINIESTSGNITVGSIKEVSWLKTESGKISAVVSDKHINQKHYFSTDTGDIDVTYTAAIISKNTIESVSGKVTLNIASRYKFLLTFKDATGKLYEKLNDKIAIDFVTDDQFTNSLKVNGYNGTNYYVEILTNGDIKASLIKA